MKTATFSAIAGYAASVLAAPRTDGYSVTHARDLSDRAIAEAVDMVFTGPAVVGGPNITLTGSAKSIYFQMLEINPKYNANEFPEYRTKMAALGLPLNGTITLANRDNDLVKRGGMNCNPEGGRVGNAIMQCTEGSVYLERLNGYCGAPRGWGGCARVSCSTNCGMFLCNDNDYPINVWCGNIAGDYQEIGRECGIAIGPLITLKGQVFRDGPPSWNTIIKSQSC